MMKKYIFIALTLVILLTNPNEVLSNDFEQVEVIDAETILESLSTEERVGQLFIVTFYGSDLGTNSDIYQLLSSIPLGGIIIKPANNNFNSVNELPSFLYNLTSSLQKISAGARYDEAGNLANTSSDDFIPLLIGFDDGLSGWSMSRYPGFSDIPSNMALGATWNPEYAYEIGEIVGSEMSALGFNMFLGPTADVVIDPRPFSNADQGNQIFGGNPYWVSQMTAFFTGGVHSGSGDMVAVFPRSFPGKGSADRSSAEEIPTVRITLDELMRNDLLPFLALTSSDRNELYQAEGMVSAHVRYAGIQNEAGKIGTPFSFDPLSMDTLLSLEPIQSWREEGGLLLSEPLGTQAIRRLYDPREVTFSNRRIAQDAFSAGNDLLYFDQFGKNPTTDQVTTISDTFDFFVTAYLNDPSFRERVDESVLRIIQLKLDIYGNFSLDKVIPRANAFNRLPDNTELFAEIARDAITLLAPNNTELLPTIQNSENLVIITDTRPVTLCPSCQELPTTAVDAFQSSILRVYGPQASGFLSYANISSYSLIQLAGLLETSSQIGGTEVPAEINPLTVSLNDADWVIFLMRGSDDKDPSSQVVKRYLELIQPVLQSRVIVIAMDSPIYLDSTEVSKLSSYIAVYDDGYEFLDLASRSIFQPGSFPGASPVTIDGIDYEIGEMTSPDPYSVIYLDLRVFNEIGELPATTTPDDTTPGGTAIASYEDFRAQLGDTIAITTHTIVDRNGNPIADGTPVTFRLRFITEGLEESTTVLSESGIASATFLLNRPGNLIISAYAGDAQSSTSIQLTIPDEGDITINLNNPQNIPTPGEATASIPDLLEGRPNQLPQTIERTMVRFGDLFLAIVGLAVISSVVYLVLITRRSMNDALASALVIMIVGLIAYTCYALQIPGSLFWYDLTGRWAAVLATWIGGITGFIITQTGYTIWEQVNIHTPRSRHHR